MSIALTEDQHRALEEGDGFVRGESYVLMSTEAYSRMMALNDDGEYAESLRAIELAMADVRAGRTRPFREFLRELGASDDVQG